MSIWTRLVWWCLLAVSLLTGAFAIPLAIGSIQGGRTAAAVVSLGIVGFAAVFALACIHALRSDRARADRLITLTIILLAVTVAIQRFWV